MRGAVAAVPSARPQFYAAWQNGAIRPDHTKRETAFLKEAALPDRPKISNPNEFSKILSLKIFPTTKWVYTLIKQFIADHFAN